MSVHRTITGNLRVMGEYRGFIGHETLTGWEHGAICNVTGEVDRAVDGCAVYPLGARFDNGPFPTRFFDTLTGPDGLLANVGQEWDRAVTMRRNEGEPQSLEEWLRIGDKAITENKFDAFTTGAGDIAKKVSDI